MAISTLSGPYLLWPLTFPRSPPSPTPAPTRQPLDSFKPLLGATSLFTGGAEGVWSQFRDEFIPDKLCGKDTTPRKKVLYSFGCLVFGAPYGVYRFMANLIRTPGTKTFPEAAGDDAVVDFVNSADAFNIRKVVIDDNQVMTGRAVEALAECYWLRELTIRECKNVSCACCGRVYVCVCVCVFLFV